MRNNRVSDHLRLFSKLSVDVVKKMTAAGTELDADALYEALQKNPEFKALLTDPTENETSASAQEIEGLLTQIKKSQGQKDQLIRQINELESRQEQINTFFKQSFGALMHLLRNDLNAPMQPALNEFKAVLEKDADPAHWMPAFQKMKSELLREDLSSPKSPPPKNAPFSFLARFSKNASKKKDATESQTPLFQHLQTTYQNIIDKLRLNLGEGYLESLAQIGRELGRCRTLEDFLDIRNALIALIQDFINNVGTERELTAAFIRDISGRLLDVESHILGSLTSANELISENQTFNAKLEEHILALKNNANVCRTLNELKDAVISRLSVINEAINIKTAQDGQRKSALDDRLTFLQQDIDLMKGKIETARERAQMLEQELLMDPLTGAYNRRAYDRKIKEEMKRYLRYRRVFSLLIFDVDHFKRINDEYGHSIGDKCLKEMISRIQPVLREVDFLARYGGEEFAVVLPETDGNQAKGAAEKLRRTVENIQFLHRDVLVKITISIGVAQVEPSDDSEAELFERADQAVYAAKNQGRNRVVVM